MRNVKSYPLLPAACSCRLLLPPAPALLHRRVFGKVSGLDDCYLRRIDMTPHRRDDLFRRERLDPGIEISIPLKRPAKEKVVVQSARQLIVLRPTNLARLQV